jgi:phosphoserine phosphatase RsbU/P
LPIAETPSGYYHGPVSTDPTTGRPAARQRSLRWQLLVPLNAAMVVIVVAFLLWDTLVEWDTQLVERRVSLQSEAESVLTAVILHRADRSGTFQAYLDNVCWRAQPESPGHHIALELGDRVMQAASNLMDLAHQIEAMRQGGQRPDGVAEAENGQIIVGTARRGGVQVWVSDPLDEVWQVLRRQILRRIASILALSAVLAVVANVLITRLVSRPLAAVVESVRHVRAGQLGSQTPEPRTEELAYLAQEFNAMSAALAAADRERRLQMEKARRIQEHLLPACRSETGLKLSCTYVPTSEVGGDYYDVRRRPDGTLLFCVADMSGHGVPAAMGAAVLKTLLVAAADRSGDPAEVLAAVGGGMADILLDGDFASMIVVAVEPGGRQLRYASAGHPAAYRVRAGEPVQALEATGPLLGIPGAVGWKTRVLDLRLGDRLLMPTDGLVETVNEQGDWFGSERMLQAIEEGRGVPLQAMCGRILDRVRTHRGTRAQLDDMTLLAAEF